MKKKRDLYGLALRCAARTGLIPSDKGRAANKDFFYGFRADMWNAFAVGVVYLDKRAEGSL